MYTKGSVFGDQTKKCGRPGLTNIWLAEQLQVVVVVVVFLMTAMHFWVLNSVVACIVTLFGSKALDRVATNHLSLACGVTHKKSALSFCIEDYW